MSKFEEDTKVRIDAADPESVMAMQKDLAAIGECSMVWQMAFNLDECLARDQRLLNGELFFAWFRNIHVTQERDLEVIITMDLNSSEQFLAAEKMRKRSRAISSGCFVTGTSGRCLQFTGYCLDRCLSIVPSSGLRLNGYS